MWLFTGTNAAATMATRSVMAATMARLRSDCTGVLLWASPAEVLSKTVIVISNPQWQHTSQSPNNTPVMLLLSRSETTPHGRQPTDVASSPGYLI